MATFTFSEIGASDRWAVGDGFSEPADIVSVSATLVVVESGQFRVEFTGTALGLGSPPTGTVTGVRVLLVDLSAPGGLREIISGSGMSAGFADLVSEASGGAGLGALGRLFAGDDTVTGSSENDLLFGGGGADSVVGGSGDDEIFGQDVNSFDVDGDGGDTLLGGDGNDYLVGGAGADSLVGGAGNDWLGDYVDAGFGAFVTEMQGDTLVGGNGSDIYVVNSALDQVRESAGEGTNDRVVMAVGTDFRAYVLPDQVENLAVLLPYNGFPPGEPRPLIEVSGNDLGNKLSVYSAFEVGFAQPGVKMLGLGGNDRLGGGSGGDTLDGGTGVDTLLGGAGDDVYVVGHLSDVVIEGLGAGSTGDRVVVNLGTATGFSLGGAAGGILPGKTFSGIEQLEFLGSAAHNGIGSAANNVLVGNTGANRLFGLGGEDLIQGGGGDDSLEGGDAADTLAGGQGRDTLVGGAGSDDFWLTHTAGGGDLVRSFESGTDRVGVGLAGVLIGDGDATIDGALIRGASGGFATDAELVIFTRNISGGITAAKAATQIGSASSSYAVGAKALFVVDNGTESAVFLFTALDGDAVVEAGELTLLATLGVSSTVVSDYFLLG